MTIIMNRPKTIPATIVQMYNLINSGNNYENNDLIRFEQDLVSIRQAGNLYFECNNVKKRQLEKMDVLKINIFTHSSSSGEKNKILSRIKNIIHNAPVITTPNEFKEEFTLFNENKFKYLNKEKEVLHIKKEIDKAIEEKVTKKVEGKIEKLENKLKESQLEKQKIEIKKEIKTEEELKKENIEYLIKMIKTPESTLTAAEKIIPKSMMKNKSVTKLKDDLKIELMELSNIQSNKKEKAEIETEEKTVKLKKTLKQLQLEEQELKQTYEKSKETLDNLLAKKQSSINKFV